MQTEEQLYSTFKVMREAGATWNMIAAETNISAKKAANIWSKMRRRERRTDEENGVPCLRCKRGFYPQSKFQKLCSRCRALPGWMAS